jgi:hypothetical protein
MTERPALAEAPPTLNRLAWWPDGLALAGVGLLSVFLFWTRVRLDPGYFNGDILTQFMPLYTMVAERVRAGDLPGWNPAYFAGMPLAGDPISGWGYLPAMGFFMFLSPLAAYQAHVMFHFILSGAATYLFGRKIGLGPLGALTAAAAYEAGPQWYFSKCCTARMQLSPWIPLGLLTVEMAARSRSWTARVIWWGLAGAVISQMIAGYFGKGMYYGILTIGCYLVYRTVIDPPSPTPPRARVIAGVVNGTAVMGIGLALAAIVILPRLDFMDRANLAGGSYEVVAPDVASDKGWTVGRAVDNVLSPTYLKYFIGGATFALATAGIVLAGRRNRAPFFALFSLGVLVMTLEPTPLHRVLYLLPKFQTIHEHVPSRILVVLNIAPAMLAGAAVSAIERGRTHASRIAAAAVAVILGYSIAVMLVEREDNQLSGEIRNAVILSATLLVIAALAQLAKLRIPRPRSSVAPFAAAVMLLGALVWFSTGPAVARINGQGLNLPSLGELPRAYADGKDGGGAGAFLKRIETDQPFRYFGFDSAFLKDEGNRVNYHAFESDLRTEAILVNNRAIMLDLQDIQGYNPVHSMRYVEFMDALNGQSQEYHEVNVLPSGLDSPLLALLNAKYVVLPVTHPDGTAAAPAIEGREVYRDELTRVLERPTALPRAWVVHDARQVTAAEMLPALSSGAIDLRSTVLLEQVPPATQPLASPTEDIVKFLSYEPDRLRVEATTSSAGVVVFSEMYDPGWHAYLDGERVSMFQANYILRAVATPAGTHTIELRYEPASLLLGTAITLTTMISLVGCVTALWLYGRPRRRRARAFIARPTRFMQLNGYPTYRNRGHPSRLTHHLATPVSPDGRTANPGGSGKRE